MNIDVSKDSKKTRRIIEMTENLGFQQLISENTRVQDASSTRLDLCFMNMGDKKRLSGVLYTDITDHYPIHFSVEKEKSSEEKMKEKQKKKELLNKIKLTYNYQKISEEIRDENWQDIYKEQNPSEQVKMLQMRIREIMKKNEIQIRVTNHYSRKNEKWMNASILRDIRRRDRLLYKTRKVSEKNKKEAMEVKIKK